MNKSKPLDHAHSIDASASNHTAKLTNKSESKCNMLSELMNFASSVPDFRRAVKGNIRHKLKDIIVQMILGRSCGHVGRADIIEFEQYNLNKFKKMDLLGNGVPSEATLCRVENGIDGQAMADRMQQFAETFHENLLKDCHGMKIICIDGKAERGTVLDNGRNPDIVSAYSYDTGITLATEICGEKSNEIKAVPRLLDKLRIY